MMPSFIYGRRLFSKTVRVDFYAGFVFEAMLEPMAKLVGRLNTEQCEHLYRSIAAHLRSRMGGLRVVDGPRLCASVKLSLSGHEASDEDLPLDQIELGGRPFRHRMVSAAGMRFHGVEGGAGDPVLLLAGFPQSWYAWRRVMPRLAERYRVIAVDLPGQGDSDKPVNGYDTRTTGTRIQALMQALGHRRYFVGAHDIGAWVAYPYTAAHPDEVRRLVLLDANIPGVTLRSTVDVGPENWKSWHFFFHPVPDLPEALLAGRERIYIEWFFHRKSANPAATFSRQDLDEYERIYRMAGNLRGALCYYRAVFEDIEQNRQLVGVRLKTPILALGGDVGMSPDIFEAMKPLGEHVEGGVISDCGHYMPEEQPAVIADRMLAFFGAEG